MLAVSCSKLYDCVLINIKAFSNVICGALSNHRFFLILSYALLIISFQILSIFIPELIKFLSILFSTSLISFSLYFWLNKWISCLTSNNFHISLNYSILFGLFGQFFGELAFKIITLTQFYPYFSNLIMIPSTLRNILVILSIFLSHIIRRHIIPIALSFQDHYIYYICHIATFIILVSRFFILETYPFIPTTYLGEELSHQHVETSIMHFKVLYSSQQLFTFPILQSLIFTLFSIFGLILSNYSITKEPDGFQSHADAQNFKTSKKMADVENLINQESQLPFMAKSNFVKFQSENDPLSLHIKPVVQHELDTEEKEQKNKSSGRRKRLHHKQHAKYRRISLPVMESASKILYTSSDDSSSLISWRNKSGQMIGKSQVNNNEIDQNMAEQNENASVLRKLSSESRLKFNNEGQYLTYPAPTLFINSNGTSEKDISPSVKLPKTKYSLSNNNNNTINNTNDNLTSFCVNNIFVDPMLKAHAKGIVSDLLTLLENTNVKKIGNSQNIVENVDIPLVQERVPLNPIVNNTIENQSLAENLISQTKEKTLTVDNNPTITRIIDGLQILDEMLSQDHPYNNYQSRNLNSSLVKDSGHVPYTKRFSKHVAFPSTNCRIAAAMTDKLYLSSASLSSSSAALSLARNVESERFGNLSGSFSKLNVKPKNNTTSNNTFDNNDDINKILDESGVSKFESLYNLVPILPGERYSDLSLVPDSTLAPNVMLDNRSDLNIHSNSLIQQFDDSKPHKLIQYPGASLNHFKQKQRFSTPDGKAYDRPSISDWYHRKFTIDNSNLFQNYTNKTVLKSPLKTPSQKDILAENNTLAYEDRNVFNNSLNNTSTSFNHNALFRDRANSPLKELMGRLQYNNVTDTAIIEEKPEITNPQPTYNVTFQRRHFSDFSNSSHHDSGLSTEDSPPFKNVQYFNTKSNIIDNQHHMFEAPFVVEKDTISNNSVEKESPLISNRIGGKSNDMEILPNKLTNNVLQDSLIEVSNILAENHSRAITDAIPLQHEPNPLMETSNKNLTLPLLLPQVTFVSESTAKKTHSQLQHEVWPQLSSHPIVAVKNDKNYTASMSDNHKNTQKKKKTNTTAAGQASNNINSSNVFSHLGCCLHKGDSARRKTSMPGVEQYTLLQPPPKTTENDDSKKERRELSKNKTTSPLDDENRDENKNVLEDKKTEIPKTKSTTEAIEISPKGQILDIRKKNIENEVDLLGEKNAPDISNVPVPKITKAEKAEAVSPKLTSELEKMTINRSSLKSEDITDASPLSSSRIIVCYDGTKYDLNELEMVKHPYLSQLGQWEFPIFDFAASPYCITNKVETQNKKDETMYQGTCLSQIAYRVFWETDLFNLYGICRRKFLNYFRALELGYQPNAYHNSIHAADVLHAVYYLTSQPIPGLSNGATISSIFAARNNSENIDRKTPPNINIKNTNYSIDNVDKNMSCSNNTELFNNDDSPPLINSSCGVDECLAPNFSPLELMALYTAAAMHDHDHPGRTNAFLISTSAKIAILYNDRSVLENHHVASAWALYLSNPAFQFLSPSHPDDFEMAPNTQNTEKNLKTPPPPMDLFNLNLTNVTTIKKDSKDSIIDTPAHVEKTTSKHDSLAKKYVRHPFGLLNTNDYKRFRYLIIESILATDLKRHFEILADFNTKISEDPTMGSGGGIDWSGSESDRLLMLQILIKIADINGPCKPRPLHLQWTERITQEFYEQGDQEARLGIEISPYMDKRYPQVAKLQESFITHLVAPLVTSYASAGYLPGYWTDEYTSGGTSPFSNQSRITDNVQQEASYNTSSSGTSSEGTQTPVSLGKSSASSDDEKNNEKSQQQIKATNPNTPLILAKEPIVVPCETLNNNPNLSENNQQLNLDTNTETQSTLTTAVKRCVFSPLTHYLRLNHQFWTEHIRVEEEAALSAVIKKKKMSENNNKILATQNLSEIKETSKK